MIEIMNYIQANYIDITLDDLAGDSSFQNHICQNTLKKNQE